MEPGSFDSSALSRRRRDPGGFSLQRLIDEGPASFLILKTVDEPLRLNCDDIETAGK